MSRYWRYLLGVILFPPVGLALTTLVEVKPDVMAFAVAILFFASIIPVGWLLMTNRVRYSFWLAAIGLYFSSGILTSLAYQVLRTIGG